MLVHLVKKVRLVSQVYLVPMVRRVRKALEVAGALRVIVEPLVLLDLREILERKVNLV